MLGSILSPLLNPIGLGDWRVVVALIAGILAKEAVPETLAIISGVEDPIEAFRCLGLTPLKAFSMLVVVLLYVPCLATIVAIYRETGSIKWTLITVMYLLLLAYCSALVVYNVGLVIGLK
ncbi:MAG: hypothetical protein DRJ26_04765 [Candidatus Methanomethylicota archaeon]|uniref:Nucleoside transporter/FeoB GTPase Gate domain-containing protein n=1 Tax=Thermoproteota archaeon TaxID=2056631 RepID=A0A497EZE3_9CREN|nr:MAG: hypothetical protein DRJ26_04765 [Candidatus Verstraetearchaeota archaeon]